MMHENDGRPIYLDYQATTPVDPRVVDAMAPCWTENFGNPHSEGHSYGHEASRIVSRARAQVADLINADDDEIVFVSGATESCALALEGVARGATGQCPAMVTLETEHPAVLETVRWLGRNGLECRILPVDGDGLVPPERIEAAIRQSVVLVSVMLGHNEIGVIQPLEDIAAVCRRRGVLLHTDATQAVGRIPVDVDRLGVDLLSFSAHKLYGPKGIGALFVRGQVRGRLTPLLHGGAQEAGLRGGTVPVPLAAGFGRACELVASGRSVETERISRLTTRLRRALTERVLRLRLFGHETCRLPGSLDAGVPGVPGDRVVRAVAPRLAVATGAACASGRPTPSHVLRALGLDDELAATGVRISLGRFTTDAQVETAASLLAAAWNDLAGQ